jgi:hypothetical protein
MNAPQWAGLAVSIISIAVAYIGSIRWLVKHYLQELKPNGGTSMKDSMNRLESRVDEIMLILATTNQKKIRKKEKNEESQISLS